MGGGGGGGCWLLAFYSLLFQLSVANSSEDPGHKGHHAASDLGQSCLPMSKKIRCSNYRKVPKFSDTPKIQTKRPNPEGIMSKTCKWNCKQ